MKALFIYYTGTYNTRFLTEKVAERFIKLGYEVDKVEIKADTTVVSTQGYNYIGFGYPIYGFNAPHPFLKYFNKLKFERGQKFFIYKNSGETMAMNNASSRKILRTMKRKKAEFCGEYHFVMPYNIHFGFDKEFMKQIFYENKKLMEIMFYNLTHGIVSKIKSNIIYNVGAFFVSIQAIGGNINSFFYKVDKQKCNLCGLCAENCPHNNIQIKDGKVKFRHHCDMCMRCSYYCPEDAVKTGFLECWHVHYYFDPEDYWQIETQPKPYITPSSKGFFKCFIKYFENIDRQYEQIKSLK